MSPWLRQLVVAVVLGFAGVILSLGAIGTAGAQGPPKAFDTRIVNTESEPVPVSLAGSVGAVPFEGDGIRDEPFVYDVPADKKAIIKFVTGTCRKTSNEQPAIVFMVNGSAKFLEGTIAPPSANTGNYFVNFTQQVLITANPGTKVFFDSGDAPAECLGFISGELVPAD